MKENRHSLTADKTNDAVLVSGLHQALEDTLSTIINVTYNATILEPYLAEAATLFAAIARDEREHFQKLGLLLHSLGASPALNTRIRTRTYHINEDADSHARVVARRMAEDVFHDEICSAKHYRNLADSTSDTSVQALLLAMAAEEECHAAELHAMWVDLGDGQGENA